MSAVDETENNIKNKKVGRERTFKNEMKKWKREPAFGALDSRQSERREGEKELEVYGQTKPGDSSSSSSSSSASRGRLAVEWENKTNRIDSFPVKQDRFISSKTDPLQSFQPKQLNSGQN